MAPPLPPEQPSPVEQRAQVAAARVRAGLPLSDEILDEVMVLRGADGGSGSLTAAERLELQSDHWTAWAQEVLAGADRVFGGLEACWIAGRRGARVRLTGEHEHYLRLLEARLGPDRVLVEAASVTEQELRALQQRVLEQSHELSAQGISLGRFGVTLGGFRIEYQAADPEAAEKSLRQRFGEHPILRWRGASNHTFKPFPFASWHAEDDHLHVFYGLPHNGERPGGCQAFETDTNVVVSVTIRDWLGAKTLVGGYTASHATVKLRQPLEHRVVIDASANRARPHWRDV